MIPQENKYVEIYNTIIDSNIDTTLYSTLYGKIYNLVNEDIKSEFKNRLKIYNKLNDTYQKIIENIKKTLDTYFGTLISNSFNDIDFNIYFVHSYNESFKKMSNKIKLLDDIFKYFYTILNQNINQLNKNNFANRNKSVRNFREIFNDLWYHNIFKKFVIVINKNILIYFNTIRKSYQLKKHEHIINDDILTLFDNIKNLDKKQELFNLYVAKNFINSSNSYYENNYKLELDLINDCDLFLKRLDEIMDFEQSLANNFTKYTQEGIKYNLIEMLITPKTSKLCKFMLSYIKSIVNIISNEKKFYSNSEEIYQYANKIQNIINYIKSTNFIFEDEVNILNNFLQKINNVVDEHLLFIPTCLSKLNIFDNMDFKELLDYTNFLQTLTNTFNNENFKKSIDSYLKNLIQKEKYQTNIYTNFIKYLEEYYINSYQNHSVDKIYYICTMLKEKDIFIIQYKKNLAKRIIKNKLSNFSKECELISKLSQNDSFVDISHLNKIIKDYHISQENIKEYQTIYDTSIDSYVITATFGIWNLQTCYTKTNYYCNNFKNLYQNFKNSYEDFYKCKYEGRNLKFFDNYNTCVLNLNNNGETYILNCNIEIADFLYQYNTCDSVPKTLNEDKSLIKYLLKTKIILEKEDCYIFNNKIKFKKKTLKLQIKKVPEKKDKSKKSNNSICFQRSDIVEAYIVRYLKSNKESDKETIYNYIAEKLRNKFTVNRELYDKCIDSLNEKEYLSIDSSNSQIKYIP